ncbi:hypothetical protein [Prosthecobacter fluviatilis]|uniref:Uncharacterized protein n=1 Tax=Prosthecobacter fluviatilis TaxID=445931 RepID=A0ABW0KUX4_9BACT
MAISNVENKESQIRVYDENSQCVGHMPNKRVEIAGFTSDFFVTVEGGWIRTYDQECERLGSMSGIGVTVRSVSGGNFTVSEAGDVRTYDRKCKEVRPRRT